MSAPLLVSVGTTHPWNIAGVGLDARVALGYGLVHAMAVAAVSAQDETGLQALHVVPADALAAQLRGLPADPAAYRIGALGSSENVRIVAAHLRDRAANVPVVVDPAAGATLGGALWADGDAMPAICSELLPLGVIVTPNLSEAQMLTGMPVADVEQMRAAGSALIRRGARAAIVKGGHLEGDPVDVVCTAEGCTPYAGERIGAAMRGSGCTLAAALACELALGRDLDSAVRSARAYVRTRIASGTMRGGLQVAF